MKKRAKYFVLEGCEGVGKTTQTQKLVDYLRAKGFKVLQTKEPGTPHAPLTMLLRGVMLDNQYDKQLTIQARELISQAIRSIHLEKIVIPALSEYDYIVQDRGILSGLAYGKACGNSIDDLLLLSTYATTSIQCHLPIDVYDSIIYLKGDVVSGLDRAISSKQEFIDGDAMETKGSSFLNSVSLNMDDMSNMFNTTMIDVNNKDIDQVFREILRALEIKE